MKEKLKHREAFEYYYSLGENRGLRKVAQKFNVTLTAVSNWSKAFNWQQRVEQRDIENAKKLEKEVDKAIVNSKADYRALIKKTVDLYKKKLDEGKIKITRPQDLETLAKLDLTLMGEPTERGELKVIDAKRKLISKINSLASREREDGTTK